MAIAPSLEQYQTLLAESGLLSRDEVRRFLNDLPPDSRPKDAQALAKALVRADKLTKFQAAAVYQGQIKELILGEYEILDKLGQGGMGVVLLARHRRMERLAAVKVLPKATMKSATAIDRFFREAKAAARLSHPNIVSAYDASEKDGTHYLVMEYVDGEDLGQISRRCGPLPVDAAVDYMIQAARGLQYAHEQGVVHRDIKPANLLVDRNDTVKILDMGLARLHSVSEAEATEQDRLTQSGQVMGTCDYMAPEQAEDTHGADHRADIYSLGCSLYRLLTGESPYKGDTLIKILMAHRDDPIPNLREKRPDVSAELASVFEKMVSKRPEDRYQSMVEAIAALERCRAGASVAAGSVNLQPGGSSEPPSDSKLTAFLQGLPEVGVARKPPRPHGETIQGQAELETGKELRPPGQRRSRPAWLLPALIGSGVFVVVLAVGLLMKRTGREPAEQADGNQVAQTVTEPHPDRSEVTAASKPPAQSASVEPVESESATAEEPTAGSAELVGQEVDGMGVSPEETARDEPEPAAQEPPPEGQPQPANPLPVENDAEAARLDTIQAQRAAEEKYRQATQEVEAMVADWDFAGAFVAIETIHLDEPDLVARLAVRREEIRLMGALKQRMIAAINAADPPLEKSNLMIRGMGGRITSASESGIAATLRSGKTEESAWTDLGNRATEKLLELAVDTTNSKMLLAGALLALAAGDTSVAEAYFDKAKQTGIDIAPYLVSVAARSLAQAIELLDSQQYADALNRLKHMEAEYGTTDWFAANREALTAARATAEKGMLDAEAESLYARAVKLRDANQLFDLRDLVDKLKAEYASSSVANDTTRSPALSELAGLVDGLGQKFTVRQDGSGDYTSIQAAIDAAPTKSLIEIQDDGTYNEKLLIPKEKQGLTVCGAPGCLPFVTSSGPKRDFPVLVSAPASDVTLKRLALIHSNPGGSASGCVSNAGPNLRLQSCILFALGGARCLWELKPRSSMDTCVVVGDYSNTPALVRNSLWLRGIVCIESGSTTFENTVLPPPINLTPGSVLSRCTVMGVIRAFGEGNRQVVDCILSGAEADKPTLLLEHSNVYGLPPVFVNEAKPGKGCFSAPPMFVNPKAFDFRLMPDSPCIGKASDGGDMGCRFTPEMLQMLQLAFELRARGIIKF